MHLIARLHGCRHPSAHSAAASLCDPAGSYSGHQADPAQLPQDMVHTGRHRRLPDRLHSAVCGNNRHELVEAAKCKKLFFRALNFSWICSWFIIKKALRAVRNGLNSPRH